ncbi:carboxypeptidase regulatory-like domain-containing protein [Archangium violaceum]|uniref:MSCRAMM family protein n=1 Tax=Archangium violaceum TaxID=83451 RepID=UPI00193C7688|nr:carboxypeptidase-like regulatory domain-containing protein [Archangium violaceum]QRK05490.1 carboxypeptidase regulatory-like domain-containing protein [Archangium violaceum]
MFVRELWVSRLLGAVVGVFVLVVSGCAHEPVGPSRSEASAPQGTPVREPLPTGSLVLRGVVTWEGKPVAGATVSAVLHADVPLSARDCVQGEPGMTILDPGCGAMKGELAQTADWLGRRSPLRETVTDADGWFEFSNLRAATYDLWASGPKGTAFVAAIPAGANVAQVPLEAGRPVTVDVMDGNSGQPLAGAQVALLPRAGGYAFLATSDAGGKVVFPRVPTGEFHAVASFPGRLAEAGPVGGDALSLRLHVPRTLSGRVLRQGEGAAGLRVQLEGEGWRRLEETRADGSFRMEGLPPGRYTLRVREGKEIATAAVRIPEEGDFTDARLSLEPCGEVTGRVARPNGAPIQGAELELLLTRDDVWRRLVTTTSADGRFRFECVDPGQVGLSIKAAGHVLPSEPMRRDLAAGSSVSADFTLQQAAPVRGRILDPEGRGLRGVRIRFFPREARSLPDSGEARGDVPRGGSATTAGDGSFEVDGLAPGRYEYELSPDETFFEARGEVRLPATNLRLKLRRKPVPTGVLERGSERLRARLSLAGE